MCNVYTYSWLAYRVYKKNAYLRVGNNFITVWLSRSN